MDNFDNLFDSTIRSMPLPNILEEGIIIAKDILRDNESREGLLDTFKNVVGNGESFIKNIWSIKDTIKDKGLKEGISEAFDILVNQSSKEKLITKETASMLKTAKSFLIEELIKEENVFKNQEKYLEDINKKYTEFENCISENNIDKAYKIQDEINRKCEKVLPTIELINKINNMDNTINLIKSKKDSITQLEKEILSKIA